MIFLSNSCFSWHDEAGEAETRFTLLKRLLGRFSVSVRIGVSEVFRLISKRLSNRLVKQAFWPYLLLFSPTSLRFGTNLMSLWNSAWMSDLVANLLLSFRRFQWRSLLWLIVYIWSCGRDEGLESETTCNLHILVLILRMFELLFSLNSARYFLVDFVQGHDQGHRFDIIEEYGCSPATYNTLPAYFLF